MELTKEFKRNFERQGFFNEAWERRKSPVRPGGTILVHTGDLRRSVRSRTTGNSITFYTDLPYADIHNEGGEIKVTQKMKGFFWRRYKETTGAFGRKKDGTLRNDKRNRRLSTEAEFWKSMALKKAGSTIKIPRRQFLGTSPEVEEIVRKIMEEDLENYFNNEFEIGK